MINKNLSCEKLCMYDNLLLDLKQDLYVGMKLYAFVVITLCSSVFMYTFAAIQFDIYLQYIKYLTFVYNIKSIYILDN